MSRGKGQVQEQHLQKKDESRTSGVKKESKIVITEIKTKTLLNRKAVPKRVIEMTLWYLAV